LTFKPVNFLFFPFFAKIPLTKNGRIGQKINFSAAQNSRSFSCTITVNFQDGGPA